jgi:hypothetical protein
MICDCRYKSDEESGKKAGDNRFEIKTVIPAARVRAVLFVVV